MSYKTSHLTIYADSREEINWFKNLDERLEHTDFVLISDTRDAMVDEILRYDKPDIIVMSNHNPLFVLEKTEQVPSGHGISQRFGRIARASELNIDSILMFPFKKRKHGENEGKCWSSPRYFEFFERINDIHKCKTLPVTQPSYDDGELVPSVSGGDKYISDIVSELIDNDWNLSDVCHPRMDKKIAEYKKKGIENNRTWPGYPGTVEKKQTKSIIDDNNVPEYLKRRKESLVVSGNLMGVRSSADPYVGKMFMYDYISVREGPTPEFRESNLFFKLPKVDHNTWTGEIPLDTDNKWGILFSMVDGVIFGDGEIRYRQNYV